MAKKNYRMPSCNGCETNDVMSVVHSLRGTAKRDALQMVEEIGERELCLVLHAMRRWYSYNTWNAAKKIIPHMDALARGMNLDPDDVVGAYRGFRVPRDHHILDFEEGDVISLPVVRNGGCSSWTLSREKANLFSGASREQAGIVIRLAESRNVEPFIAPPSRSENWFNQLYERSMNRSFRFNEEEYAIYGTKLICEIVAIKT